MATKKDDGEISVLQVQKGRIDFCVLGSTPIILNRMSDKVRRELLAPRGKKNSAEKASSLKHDPLQEFRDSAYQSPDPKAPTLIMHGASSFKGALRTAALDMPGTKKSQIGRLTYVEGDYVPIYGIPKLFMSVTRSADMNKTPDVRTRCIIPQWACFLAISYVKPLLRDQVVSNLLAAAGIYAGTGDWRPEKGAGSYGQFELVSADDDRFAAIVNNCGRAAQIKAMKEAAPYDSDTSDLLEWYTGEVKRRGFDVPSLKIAA